MKNWRKYLSILMVVFGVGLLAYDPLLSLYITHNSNSLNDVEVVPIDEVMAQTRLESEETETETKPLDEEESIEQEEEKSDVEKFLDDVQSKTDPTEPVDTYWDTDSNQTVIGKVSIPSVDLNLAIVKGVGQEQGDPMMKGASTNKLGQEMGKRNYVLSSHSAKDPTILFAPLFRTNYGDKIYLTDEKNVYVYKISLIDTIEPERVDILDDIAGKKVVTLYTCTQAGRLRLMIQGELQETLEYNSETASYFK